MYMAKKNFCHMEILHKIEPLRGSPGKRELNDFGGLLSLHLLLPKAMVQFRSASSTSC